MFLSLEYKVTYKEAPKEPQQTVVFPKLETANLFAIAIERNGGIAVVTSAYVKAISMPTDFPTKKG